MEEMRTVETTQGTTVNNKFAHGVTTGIGITVIAFGVIKGIVKGVSALREYREFKKAEDDVEAMIADDTAVEELVR